LASILVVDDELSMREFLKILLEKEGYSISIAQGANEALELTEQQTFDLIISDIKMPEIGGLGLLKTLRQQGNNVPIILITAYASPEDAVEAMKGGAFDYITKPFNVDEIKAVIRSSLAGAASSEIASPQVDSFDEIIGQSPEMLKIFDLIQRIAPTHANVLIHGESGTGKELVAQAIHRRSKAASHNFVPIVCSAIPESLFESEVFGHVKGSFTGASSNKIGLFEEANNGSAFLDEIGELSPLIQTKLLRVLQEREFKPVGGTKNIKVNVRIISATNKNLEQEIIAGNFREDLFYRLAVVPIRLPPLRERKGDVPLLVRHFLEKYSKLFGKDINELSSYAMEVLMNYDFPGNVRELENIIERGVALENSNIILPESLTLSAHRQEKAVSSGIDRSGVLYDEEELFDRGLDETIAKIEKFMLRQGLKRANNSKMKAAEELKISFRSFRYKVKKYGLD
jgi:two-component system response regulator PilR (NtrC family)